MDRILIFADNISSLIIIVSALYALIYTIVSLIEYSELKGYTNLRSNLILDTLVVYFKAGLVITWCYLWLNS